VRPAIPDEALGAVVRYRKLVAAIRSYIRRCGDEALTRGQLIAYYGRKHPDIAGSDVPLAVDAVLRGFWR